MLLKYKQLYIQITCKLSGLQIPPCTLFHNEWVGGAAVCISYTHCLRDLLVLEALEVAMLVHAVHHCAGLWFYPALCHKVQLCVHIYGLHLGVVVIISGETGVPWKTKDVIYTVLLVLSPTTLQHKPAFTHSHTFIQCWQRFTGKMSPAHQKR